MIDVEELVQPFDGDSPTGPNLSDSNEFAEIERLHMDAFNPPQLVSTGGEPDDPDWAGVVRLGREFLESKSKELKVAAWITNASLRTSGFEGFAESLELCHSLMEKYWEGLHPGIPARAAVLDWLCDDYSPEQPCFAIYQVGLTEGGHTYFEFREWLKGQEEPAETVQGTDKYSKKDEPEEDEEAGFGASFLATPRDWYVEVIATLERCEEAITKIDGLSKERFPPAGETPPSFSRKIGASLKAVHSAATQLLELKPAPVVADIAQPLLDDESPGEPGAPSVSGSVLQPRSEAEALRAIAAGVRYIRQHNPQSPGPYLVLRALRWGELLASGPEIDPLLLDPPETALRIRLKKLYLQAEWADLLETSEEAMASSSGRGWLDIHHYSIMAAEELGPEYSAVTEALYSSLRGLLQDRPSLVSMALMDDSYSASGRTLDWLQAQDMMPEGSGGGRRRPAPGGGRRSPSRPPPKPKPTPPAAVEAPESSDSAEHSGPPLQDAPPPETESAPAPAVEADSDVPAQSSRVGSLARLKGKRSGKSGDGAKRGASDG